VQLQLCQPSTLDSPQRRFLDTVGEGVYHIGFEVADLGAADAEGQRLHLGVVARGRRADGSGFCYFDTREALGVVLEVRKSPEPFAADKARPIVARSGKYSEVGDSQHVGKLRRGKRNRA
jgi:hypothetical protein